MTRKFSVEGAVNLYSSSPSILFASELYLAKEYEELRKNLELCNLYIITNRKKIHIDPSSLKVEDACIKGIVIVYRDQAWMRLEFNFPMQAEHHAGSPSDVKIHKEYSSSYITITNINAQTIRIPTYILVAGSCADFREETDLDILYVGIGIGKTKPRIAVDRLLTHYQLQKILAKTITDEPDSEIIILMFRFEHSRKILSNGGDLSLDPTASDKEDDEHFTKLQTAKLPRKNRVLLAEAALINYFKPPYNTMHRNTNFASQKRLILTKMLDEQGITGVIVEVCTYNIKSRLKSDTRPPKSLEELLPGADFSWLREATLEQKTAAQTWLSDVAHSCTINIPLTSPSIRNTFLHGLF
jgi:hypothetical protein